MRKPWRRFGWLAVFSVLAAGATPVVLAEPLAGPFTVDSFADELDNDTSDGLCQTDANECTLRAAVMQANTTSGLGATILLPAGTYTLTRPATGPDDATSGDLNWRRRPAATQ